MFRIIAIFVGLSGALVGCGESSVRHHDHDRGRHGSWLGWYVTDPGEWNADHGFVSAVFFGGRLEFTLTDRENPDLRWMATGKFHADEDRNTGVWSCTSMAVYRVGNPRARLLLHRRAGGTGGYRAERQTVDTFLSSSKVLATSLPREVVECGAEVQLSREVTEAGRLRIVVEGKEGRHPLLFHGAEAFREALDPMGEPTGPLTEWKQKSLYGGRGTIFEAPTNQWLPVAQTQRFYVVPEWSVEDDGENWVLTAHPTDPITPKSFKLIPNGFIRAVIVDGRWHRLEPVRVSGEFGDVDVSRNEDGSFSFTLPKAAHEMRVSVRYPAEFPESGEVIQEWVLETGADPLREQTRLHAP